MVGSAAVGVDDDLAAGQTGVGCRTAEDERAGRIHQHAVFVVGHTVGEHVIQHRTDHMFGELFLKPCLVHFRVVLGGDQHGVETHGMVIVVVFDGHLRLAIRTKMRHLAALAHFGETIRQTVRQMNRQRHKHVGLVARIAEHHALVARALRLIPLFTGRLRLLLATQPGNALVDFRTLLGKRHRHTAGIGVKSHAGAGVADIAHHGAHDVLDVGIAFAGHLTEHEELSDRGAGLHGDMGMRILREHIIENRIGNLVADLSGWPSVTDSAEINFNSAIRLLLSRTPNRSHPVIAHEKRPVLHRRNQ